MGKDGGAELLFQSLISGFSSSSVREVKIYYIICMYMYIDISESPYRTPQTNTPL